MAMPPERPLCRAASHAGHCHDGQIYLAARADETGLAAALIRWRGGKARPFLLSRPCLLRQTPDPSRAAFHPFFGQKPLGKPARGEIRLSRRFAQLDPQLIEYVAAHEIASEGNEPRSALLGDHCPAYPGWRGVTSAARRASFPHWTEQPFQGGIPCAFCTP